jgi:hypothetical protein
MARIDHHAANNDERNPFGRPRHARGVRERQGSITKVVPAPPG